MVAGGNEDARLGTSGFLATERTSYLPSHPNEKHPLHRKLSPLICQLSGNNSKAEAFLQQLPISWKHRGEQYESTLSKWKLYCRKREVNPFSSTVAEGVNFIGELYDEGIGYSGLNTARSALSAIITLSNNISFGYHPSVPRFMKGVYETRPSLPKYQEIFGCSYRP